MNKLKILFLAKEKPLTEHVIELIKLHVKDPDIKIGKLNDKFPVCLNNEYDIIISYISPWIVPYELISKTKIAAINFHPGPPEYPGIGCTNFAIYNSENEYGITVHHMEKKVDTGKIISVKRFPIFKNDTVYSLSVRCYAYIYVSFVEIFSMILLNKKLPSANERWYRKPYTRKELNDLCKITPDMTENETERRVRATSFPDMPGAFVEIKGKRCKYEKGIFNRE
ncbi:MAG: hypothetical protein ACD_79C01302G0009 [uncultured bacterium]|nr:MAG: hypothetical protein ACD_79C01302G0009 [uncultured bacterium]